jgi:hypothetical protein
MVANQYELIDKIERVAAARQKKNPNNNAAPAKKNDRASRLTELTKKLEQLKTNVSARRQRPSTAGRALTPNEKKKLTTLMKDNQNLSLNVGKLINEIETGAILNPPQEP